MKPILSATLTLCLLFIALFSLLSQAQASNIEELIEANESQNSETAIDFVLNDLMEQTREGSSQNPVFRRAFHNKANACVTAQFTVFDNTDNGLNIGLFATPLTYNAWVRYSNGSSQREADRKRQPRAVAIKVLDTQLPMLEDEPGDLNSHDFLLANNPVFFLKSLQELVDDGIPFFNGRILGTPIPTLGRFSDAGTSEVNPLRTQYFSQSAYALGSEQAVKYRILPCSTNTQIDPGSFTDNGIRVALYEGISQQDQCYDFQIQVRENPATMPIENPTVEWTSSFTTVGQLSIPQQGFTDPSQDNVCEQLAFNPWHASADHRPLGALNRVRKMAYKMASIKRRAAAAFDGNGEQAEPAADSTDGFGVFFNPPQLVGSLGGMTLMALLALYLKRRKNAKV